jgi:hypothetical protein
MLYPANETALRGGVLTAHLTRQAGSAGPVTFTMPDGEILTGRYTLFLGGSVSFGGLYSSMYSARGVATGSAFSTAFAIPSGSPAVADAVGPKGTTIHCEVYNNNWTNHGAGACEVSTGARYRLQY